MSSSELWRPSADLAALRLRAQTLARLRAFFAERGVLEVETPLLSHHAIPDPALASLAVSYHGPHTPAGGRLYLHTSPEFAMKRLLCAGSGDIYQVCKVFRDGEAGRLHNPEFTMVEWYRLGFDHHRLMEEVEALLRVLLAGVRELGPAERLSYGEAFRRYAGVDPHRAPVAELIACAAAHRLPPVEGLGPEERDGWLDWLLTQLVEPRLGREGPTFLHDYPASQAALARVRPGEPPLAERFELYLDGVELANGFHELGDAAEQRRRFVAENGRRAAAGLAEVPYDRHLLAALESGLPPCAGVALGLDRLLLAATGARSLAEVIAFTTERA